MCICTSATVTRDVVYLGWPIAPSYMSPNAGVGGELRGSQSMSIAVHRSPINYGNLTPYLVYVFLSYTLWINFCNRGGEGDGGGGGGALGRTPNKHFIVLSSIINNAEVVKIHMAGALQTLFRFVSWGDVWWPLSSENEFRKRKFSCELCSCVYYEINLSSYWTVSMTNRDQAPFLLVLRVIS